MTRDPAAKPLKSLYTKAFEYSDCWVNDARFVALNARDAADRGAVIRTRTKVVSARRDANVWTLTLQDDLTGTTEEIRSRLVVNAAGPWVDEVLTGVVGSNNAHNVRLVQGSHIVVRKKFDDPRAYFFQNTDGRIIFAIPYEQDFTLIGTTDQDYHGNPAEVKISDAEIDYLCAAASEYFVEPVKREHVVWTYSGVRPLYDDGASKAQEATRDYVLKADAPHGQAPLLNIFGGKITTYRRLSEHMLEKIEDQLGKRGSPGPPLALCRAAILRQPPSMPSCTSSRSIILFCRTFMRTACSGFTVRKSGHCSGAQHRSTILAGTSALIFTRRRFATRSIMNGP